MLKKYGLYISWFIACVAILGSLYYSHLRHLEPCNLCWYQRICLFPLGIILGIACYRGFSKIVPFVLPQVFFGMLFAGYQVAIQQVPGWNPIELCGAGPNCTEKINILGTFITLPMISLLVFTSLAFVLIKISIDNRKALASVRVKR